MTIGVYSITSHSGGQYIGSSIQIERRWGMHKHYLKKGNHWSKALQRAYLKYGIENIKYEIIHVCFIENLLKLEQLEIDTRKPRYNSRPTAESQLGYKHTEEANEKNRQAHLGKKHTEETKRKLSAKLKGDPRLSGMRGMVLSPEAKAKQSASLKGNNHKDGFEANMTEELLQTIIEEHQSGMGIVKLGMKYHTSHKLFQRLFRERGIELKPVGGRPGSKTSYEAKETIRKALLKFNEEKRNSQET